jgi:transcriptional regulator with XRE-family HTH domain
MARAPRQSEHVSVGMFDEMVRVFSEAGISRVELARRLGVSPGAVTRYMNRENDPSAAMLERWFLSCGAPLRAMSTSAPIAVLLAAASGLDERGLADLARTAEAWRALSPDEREEEADAIEAKARRRLSTRADVGKNPGAHQLRRGV